MSLVAGAMRYALCIFQFELTDFAVDIKNGKMTIILLCAVCFSYLVI